MINSNKSHIEKKNIKSILYNSTTEVMLFFIVNQQLVSLSSYVSAQYIIIPSLWK